jgi:hypothetical protein
MGTFAEASYVHSNETIHFLRCADTKSQLKSASHAYSWYLSVLHVLIVIYLTGEARGFLLLGLRNPAADPCIHFAYGWGHLEPEHFQRQDFPS